MSSLKIKNNGVWETIAAIEGKRGPNGIAVDSIEPIDQEIKVWIDPNGDPLYILGRYTIPSRR